MILFFVVSGSYLLITEFWYFGTAKFYISEKNTNITIQHNGEFLCKEKQCSYKLIPGEYAFSIKKENFKPVFGKIKIKMQKNTEKKIFLKRKSTQIFIEKNHLPPKNNVKFFYKNFNNEKNVFHEVFDFSIKDNFLHYKNTKIFRIENNNIHISSDEVGRGYWIVMPQKIKFFSISTQEISTVVYEKQSKISQFLSLNDGSFIIKISGKYFWKPFFSSLKVLNISPISIAHICKLGKNFMFIENSGKTVEIKKYNIFQKETTSWGILENFPIKNFQSMQCVGNTKVIIFFNDSKKYPSIVLEKK